MEEQKETAGLLLGFTDDENWFLALASIFAAVAEDRLEGFDSGRDNGEVRDYIRKNWYVADKATLEQAVLRLVMGEKRELYLKRRNMIIKFYNVVHSNKALRFICDKVSFKFASSWYFTKTRDDIKKLVVDLEFDKGRQGAKNHDEFDAMLKNAAKWTEYLAEQLGDYKKIDSFLGWDAVKLAGLVRYAVQVYIIERADFVRLLLPIKKQLQQQYGSWREIVLSFAVGEFLDNYKTEEQAQAYVSRLNSLLNTNSSPICKVPFK